MNYRAPFLLLVSMLWGLAAQAAVECEPQVGFDLGLAGEPALQQCEARDYRMAFELGRQIQALRAEQSERLAAEGDKQAARLRVIARELSQLEGLARIQGLLHADP